MSGAFGTVGHDPEQNTSPHGRALQLNGEHDPPLTLDAVGPDVPPFLGAGLLVLHQVVADGHAAVRVGLHEGDGHQALGNS